MARQATKNLPERIAKPAAMKTDKARAAIEDAAQPAAKRRKSEAVKETKVNGVKAPVKKSPSTAKTRTSTTFRSTAPTKRLDVFVFGSGESGELGLGAGKNVTDVKAPRLNPLLTAEKVGVVQVACGGMHAAALTHDNKVLTWGINDQYTLGRDTNWDGGLRDMDADDSDDESVSDLNPLESTPAPIPADKLPKAKIVQVAAGDSTTFILTEDGLVYGWGSFRDHNGFFGFTYDQKNHKIIKFQNEPLLIPGLSKIVRLRVGPDFVLALDDAGAVFAWGTGQQDELGRRLLERRAAEALLPHPVKFPRKSVKIRSIHTGSNHCFAIDTKGDTWAWGLNNFAQTGISEGAGEGGNTVTAAQRVPALVGKDMKLVCGGSHHSIAVSNDGACFVWGRMDGGQLGLDVSKIDINDPKKVVLERGKPRILLQPTPLPIQGCVEATSGPDHSLVVTSEGTVFSWGFNVNYQCGQGTTDDILIAKLMNGKAIRERKITWAGAGGQYSMLACPTGPESNRPPTMNGTV